MMSSYSALVRVGSRAQTDGYPKERTARKTIRLLIPKRMNNSRTLSDEYESRN